MSANTNEMTDESLVDTMPVKHKSLIASIIKFSVLSIFMVIAVFGGLLVGKIIVGKLDTFDPTKYSAENYIESQSNIAFWSTKQIGDLTPTQIFVVAQARLSNCSYYGVYTKGYNGEDKGVVTTLGMKQDLYGYRYVVDGNGYFDYYSTGLATVVKKVEYKVGEDKFYCYEGVIKNGTTTWTLKMAEDGKDYRNAVEYKQMVGCDADNPIDYIISTKTVKEEKSNGVKDGLHSFTLNSTLPSISSFRSSNGLCAFGVFPDIVKEIVVVTFIGCDCSFGDTTASKVKSALSVESTLFNIFVKLLFIVTSGTVSSGFCG